MDDIRAGRALRMLRQRRGWRQVDLASLADVSQGTVSLIERGHLDTLSVRTVRRIFTTVEARYQGAVLWRGGGIDRVLDERHAWLVGATVKLLERRQWTSCVEVTYSIYGERGSIDVLAGLPSRRIALVIEVKSELTSIEQMARKLDEKVRLASTRLVADRLGWRPVTVGRLLILPATDTARRSVTRHSEVLDVVLPARGRIARAWLRAPSGAFAGLLFVADTNGRSGSGRNPGRRRVRVPRVRSPRA